MNLRSCFVRAVSCVSVALSCVSGCDGNGSSAKLYLELGRARYETSCAACHAADGGGRPGVASPLAGSEWVTADEGILIRIALHGVRGEIVVKGKTYNLEMPGFHTVFGDQDLAAILSYVRQAWGNRAEPIEPATVAQLRSAFQGRGDSWTAAELMRLDPAAFNAP